MDCLRRLNVRNFLDRYGISWNLRTALLGSCFFQVAFILILLIFYIPTAIEATENYPDEWKVAFINICMRVVPLLIYGILLYCSWKKLTTCLMIWMIVINLFFVILKLVLIVLYYNNEKAGPIIIWLHGVEFSINICVIVISLVLYCRERSPQPVNQIPDDEEVVMDLSKRQTVSNGRVYKPVNQSTSVV
ncbi:uncharacterized protein [Halyomorpha halys]|uniref:uncharacterized protein n=1 Tax=Halyomorpha halys TaxID=286706 RepID=UPI0006D4E19E|nr:uncharacterized protein LOC106677555 [Halyomorpha halys]